MAVSLKQSELIHALVLRLLVPDVLPDHGFVSPYGRDEIPSRPEVLTYEVPLPLGERSRDVDRALPLEEPDNLRDRVLRRDRDHHVHVVRHEMPLLDAALLLLRKRSEDRTEVAAHPSVEYLASAFRNEHDVVLALPLRVTEALIIIHLESLS